MLSELLVDQLKIQNNANKPSNLFSEYCSHLENGQCSHFLAGEITTKILPPPHLSPFWRLTIVLKEAVKVKSRTPLTKCI